MGQAHAATEMVSYDHPVLPALPTVEQIRLLGLRDLHGKYGCRCYIPAIALSRRAVANTMSQVPFECLHSIMTRPPRLPPDPSSHLRRPKGLQHQARYDIDHDPHLRLLSLLSSTHISQPPALRVISYISHTNAPENSYIPSFSSHT